MWSSKLEDLWAVRLVLGDAYVQTSIDAAMLDNNTPSGSHKICDDIINC